MKRTRSYSSVSLPSKQHKTVGTIADLTSDALYKHDLSIGAVSPFALFDMIPQDQTASLTDIPSLPPPSTRSSQRSRSSSPARPSDAQYRVNHLRRANIFIDDDTSTDVCSFGMKILQDSKDNPDLDWISEKLWKKSKDLAKKPSGEAEWTEILHTSIDELIMHGLEVVRNRDWRGDLKPPVHNPPPTLPRKRRQSNGLIHGAVTNNSPFSTESSHAAGSSSPMPAVPVFKLKDPRPDICIGLSDNSLVKDFEPERGSSAARSFLFDLQDTATLISDPHVTPLGLRFPFLIVEAKAGATGGNLYQAQNQAAVGGSTALQILRNLSELKYAQNLERDVHEGSGASTGPPQNLPDVSSDMVFSFTTEGPIHELWLHFRRPNEEDFYMNCVGTWRTTVKDDCMNLLRHLWAILKWGNGDFRQRILNALQTLRI